MQLRVSVESAGAEVLDSEVREIAVPDLTAPQITIGTPAVYRGRTVPEYQRLKTDAQAHADHGARVQSNRTRLHTCACVRAGNVSGDSHRQAVESHRAVDGRSDRLATPPGHPNSKDVELSLAAMPPGEYVVEITATGEGEPVKELVGFRLTS